MDFLWGIVTAVDERWRSRWGVLTDNARQLGASILLRHVMLTMVLMAALTLMVSCLFVS